MPLDRTSNPTEYRFGGSSGTSVVAEYNGASGVIARVRFNGPGKRVQLEIKRDGAVVASGLLSDGEFLDLPPPGAGRGRDIDASGALRHFAYSYREEL